MGGGGEGQKAGDSLKKSESTTRRGKKERTKKWGVFFTKGEKGQLAICNWSCMKGGEIGKEV